MDQGSTRKHSAVHNFARAVTKFCVMWEGLSLPHDTKFRNTRGEIVDRRMIFIWSLIHGSSWSRLIKAEPVLITSERHYGKVASDKGSSACLICAKTCTNAVVYNIPEQILDVQKLQCVQNLTLQCYVCCAKEVWWYNSKLVTFRSTPPLWNNASYINW